MNRDKTRNRIDALQSCLAHTNEILPRPVVAYTDSEARLEQVFGDDYKNQLRPAAVLIPVFDRASGLTVLLTERSPELRAHAGQVAFPGGRREEGDDNFAGTALREAHEEVGLEPEYVSVLGYLEDYPTISRFLVTPVVGLVDEDAPIQADGMEVSSTFEVPLDRILDNTNYEREMVERYGARFPVYTLTHEGHKVWGATAAMLLSLRSLLLEYMQREESPNECVPPRS